MKKFLVCLIIIGFLLCSCRNSSVTSPVLDLTEMEISQLVIKFMKAFEKLMYLDADEIVKDFTPSCRGRQHQWQTIVNHQASWGANPFTLEVQFLSPVTFGAISSEEASGICVTNRFISVQESDGSRNSVVCTHIYTSIVEDERWWLCNYKVEYETGSEALFMKLFGYEVIK